MASRELTFEEEACVYEQEVANFLIYKPLSEQELNVLNCGLRIIQKAKKIIGNTEPTNTDACAIEPPKSHVILYKCDRRECERCSYPECDATANILHAANFVKNAYGAVTEIGTCVCDVEWPIHK